MKNRLDTRPEAKLSLVCIQIQSLKPSVFQIYITEVLDWHNFSTQTKMTLCSRRIQLLWSCLLFRKMSYFEKLCSFKFFLNKEKKLNQVYLKSKSDKNWGGSGCLCREKLIPLGWFLLILITVLANLLTAWKTNMIKSSKSPKTLKNIIRHEEARD